MIDETKLDALFLKAKNAPHISVFNETKEQFLIASSGSVDKMTSKKGRFKSFNKGIIMLVITGVIALSCFFMLSDIEKNNTENTSQAKVELENEFTKKESPIKEDNTFLHRPNKMIKAFDGGKISSLDLLPVPDSLLDKREKKLANSFTAKKKTRKRDQNNDFVFPKLTQKEISDNNRRKKKMLKALNKKDKKVYSYIPAGSFIYKSKPVSVAAFHIQREEVTNVEYKTFLFDLLIQGRKADFLIAKPKQELWTEELGEDYKYLQDDYFSGKDYEDHPVNNISRKGAEMYCVWITRQANEVNKANGKALINDVRIPMRTEWMKVATFEGKHLEYAYEDSTSSLCLHSNFSMEGYVPIGGVFHNRYKDTLAYRDSSAITTRGAVFFVDRDIISESLSYPSNEYGMYNMCGNVAEMVYESISSNDQAIKVTPSEMGTAGGGWMNTYDEIKLNAEDLYQGVEEEHLNIGFRVVITYSKPSN